MIITLTRSGGFIGVSQKKTIDTARLSAEKAKEIEALVTKSNLFEDTSNSTTTKQQPDRFTYNISIQHENIDKTIDIHETSLTPELQKLIDYLKNC